MVKKQKIKATIAKNCRNKDEISVFIKKNKNYDNNINDINSNQKNSFYLFLKES